jgi:hypothetical protein
LHIRLPKSLHERLRAAADEQDATMNTLVVALLAREFGIDLTESPRDAATSEGATHEEQSHEHTTA